MNKRSIILYLKVLLFILLACLNAGSESNHFRVFEKNSLSPKSLSYEKFVDLEKKELFIKNLIHGYSSSFFTLTNSFSGVLANLQLLPILDDNQIFLDKKFLTYISEEHNRFLGLFNNFKNIQAIYVFSENKNIEKAWVEFKKLSNAVRTSCDDLNKKITDLIQEQDNIKNSIEIRKTLELILRGSSTISQIFNITLKCVETPDKLVELFNINELIGTVLNNYKFFNSNAAVSIHVDSSVKSLKNLILGNRILLDNVLENFFNNAVQHKKEKINIEIFLDNSSNEIVFQFNNDSDSIEDYALEKVNNRERLFYLNYATKGMGVGTTFAWHISNMFGHSVRAYNKDKGVTFEYRIQVLDSISISILKRILKGEFHFKEFEKIKYIYKIMQDTRNYFIIMRELGVDINSMCMPHSIVLAQILRSRGIPADVYMIGEDETILSLTNVDTVIHFWVETDDYILDSFPEGLGMYRQNVERFMIESLPILRRRDKKLSFYKNGVNATTTQYQRSLKDVANPVIIKQYENAV